MGVWTSEELGHTYSWSDDEELDEMTLVSIDGKPARTLGTHDRMMHGELIEAMIEAGVLE